MKLISFSLTISLLAITLTSCVQNTQKCPSTFWGEPLQVKITKFTYNTIKGSVVDENQAPMSNVLIEVFEYKKKRDDSTETLMSKKTLTRLQCCFTNKEGKFVLKKLKTGQYELRFSKEWFKTWSFIVNVDNNIHIEEPMMVIMKLDK